MITAVLLAAGRSRRMGRQKVLLPYAGTTVVEHIIDVLQRGGVDEVVVVTGHQADRVRQVLENAEVTLAHNDGYDEGMLSSIRCGMRAAKPHASGYLITLGDQPSLRVEVVSAMSKAFGAMPPRSKVILVPTFEGRRGHPILVERSFRDTVMTCFDGEGLRGLLRAAADRVHPVLVTGPEVLHDMDRPEDYLRELDADQLG